MDRWEVFSILGIDETSDKDVIKRAYRKQLVKCNPEEHPEEFKRLREAFDEANKIPVEGFDLIENNINNSKDIFEIWLGKIDSVYSDLRKRVCKDEWILLLEDPIYNDLDTINEARDKFIYYMEEHYYLTQDVWRYIESTIQIKKNRKELEEKHPNNFLQFIIEATSNEDIINFKLFTGFVGEIVDKFIRNYLDLRGWISEGRLEKAEVLIKELRTYPITHPYLQVEELKYYHKLNNIEIANHIFSQLYRRYDDMYINYNLADYLWKCNRHEEAYELAKDILRVNDKHYVAKKIESLYFAKVGMILEASEGLIDLLDLNSEDDEILNELHKVNDILIANYSKDINLNPQDNNKKIELAWCLYQNERPKEALSVLNSIFMDETVNIDYYNLKGRLFLIEKQYDNCIYQLVLWLEKRKQMTVDETPYYTCKCKNYSLAYFLISKAYYEKYLFDTAIEKYKNSTIKYAKQAIEIEKRKNRKIEYIFYLAQIYLKYKMYEECITCCNELLELDYYFVAANIYRQESFYELRMVEDVIKEFYVIQARAPMYPKCYKLAAEVFLGIGNATRALEIIELANESEVDSKQLNIVEIKVRRALAMKREDFFYVIALCDQLKQELRKDLGDVEDYSDLIVEEVNCFIKVEEFKKATEVVDFELMASPNNEKILKLRADVAYNLKMYEDARVQYMNLLYKYPNNVEYVLGLADCFQAIQNIQEAIDLYIKAIKIDNKNIYAYRQLVDIYVDLYNNKKDKNALQSALYYAEKWLQYDKSIYALIKRGELYYGIYDLPKAREDFEKAFSEDNDYYIVNRLGFICKDMGDFHEAVKYFQFAIEYSDEDVLKRSKYDLAYCYQAMGDYEKSIEIFNEIAFDENEKPTCNLRISECYKNMGRFEDAIYYLKENKKIEPKYLATWEYEIAKCYILCRKYNEAYEILSYLEKHLNKTYEIALLLGNYYLLADNNFKMAKKYYNKALAIAEKNKEEGVIPCVEALLTLNYFENGVEGFQYLKRLTNLITFKFQDINLWLNDRENSKRRFFQLGQWNYYVNNFERASQNFVIMEKVPKCTECDYKECYRVYIARGYFKEINGDMEGAIVCYEKALEINPDIYYVIQKLKGLKRR